MLDKLDCVVQTPSLAIRAQALNLDLDIQYGSTCARRTSNRIQKHGYSKRIWAVLSPRKHISAIAAIMSTLGNMAAVLSVVSSWAAARELSIPL